eukprot:8813852-Lingulodinium_polyedra.AAC.1
MGSEAPMPAWAARVCRSPSLGLPAKRWTRRRALRLCCPAGLWAEAAALPVLVEAAAGFGVGSAKWVLGGPVPVWANGGGRCSGGGGWSFRLVPSTSRSASQRGGEGDWPPAGVCQAG